MIHFICQEWSSTKGNHAGMVHLFNQIHDLDGAKTRIWILPIRKKRINYLFVWLCLLLKLIVKTKSCDVVFFTECLSMGNTDQSLMAKWLRVFRPAITICGMVHLIPSLLENLYPKKDYSLRLDALDKIITLGSSLTSYLVKHGCCEGKIATSFHYVDSSYYDFKRESQQDCHQLECLVMGNLGRDFPQIAQIAKQVHNIRFLVCKGRKEVSHIFQGIPNVELFGYMEENELRSLMERADISLNVMEDTIGSNVICTSLAMSLAMVCSDVGSIRDYCDEQNACFCSNTEEFIAVLNRLSDNPLQIRSMQSHSYELSKRLQIKPFYKNLLQISTK